MNPRRRMAKTPEIGFGFRISNYRNLAALLIDGDRLEMTNPKGGVFFPDATGIRIIRRGAGCRVDERWPPLCENGQAALETEEFNDFYEFADNNGYAGYAAPASGRFHALRPVLQE